MRKAQVSHIDWRESNSRELVAFENGRLLDTQENASSVYIQSYKSQLVVVGLGSGFLLNRLTQEYPNHKLTIIECRESLVRRQRKHYPQVDFVVIQTIDELMKHPDYLNFLSPETEKILYKQAAGAQISFFQEVFWNLNLRTVEAVKKVTNLAKPIDDRWLINMKQLLESVEFESLPYKKSEILIVQELMK